MPMLPGTIEQDQMMPQVAPQFAPPVSPVPMPQMLGTQMSPYIGSGAYQAPDSPSVLNTPDINKAIQQQTLAQIQALGNNSSDKRDRIRNIFTGIMAPAMAIFGGAGTAAAGADLIQQARQQAVIGKQQGLAEKQNAAAALKGLVDIENTIRLKPLGMMLKDQRTQGKLAQGDRRLTMQEADTLSKITARSRGQDIKEARFKVLAENEAALRDLKRIGLELKDKGLDQVKQIAEMQDRRIREIAVINNQIKKYGIDQTREAKKAQLQQEFQIDKAKMIFALEQRNQSIRAQLDQHNNSTVRNKGGELLNPDQYMLEFNGIDIQAPQGEPDDDDFATTVQSLMQPAQAQPAQAPAATPQKPAAPAQTAQQSRIPQGLDANKTKQGFIRRLTAAGVPFQEAMKAANQL